METYSIYYLEELPDGNEIVRCQGVKGTSFQDAEEVFLETSDVSEDNIIMVK